MNGERGYAPGKCPSCHHDQHVGRVCLATDSPGTSCGCPPEAAVKETGGKARGFYMIPWDSLAELAEIYTYGLEKGYLKDSWRLVPLEDYIDALCRHLKEILKGEALDPGSGKRHAAHLLWNAVTICELTREKGKKGIEDLEDLEDFHP